MDWRCGSSGEHLLCKVQSLEFKPQSHQNLKKKSEYHCLQPSKKSSLYYPKEGTKIKILRLT
jgi:hypothetical protein